PKSTLQRTTGAPLYARPVRTHAIQWKARYSARSRAVSSRFATGGAASAKPPDELEPPQPARNASAATAIAILTEPGRPWSLRASRTAGMPPPHRRGAFDG